VEFDCTTRRNFRIESDHHSSCLIVVSWSGVCWLRIMAWNKWNERTIIMFRWERNGDDNCNFIEWLEKHEWYPRKE
jgi:hypothetical protein